ncbi:hypothetical protein GJAV_G00059480 [Gymnothorax javanicus]|nr:hypothetical protein GJAV_G00059480 [Gymnothorax javanicus]
MRCIIPALIETVLPSALLLAYQLLRPLYIGKHCASCRFLALWLRGSAHSLVDSLPVSTAAPVQLTGNPRPIALCWLLVCHCSQASRKLASLPFFHGCVILCADRLTGSRDGT